jgi:NADH dehydrogenase
MPDAENRITLLIKWLWMIATRQRAGLLITGRTDQHMGVEVGLERAERVGDETQDPQQVASVS